MEDSQIIDLYWGRDQRAITETDLKYGKYCHAIAFNVLSIIEDAEECVNDTYIQAWNSMPPNRPTMLKAWLGKVVRNIAINLWDKNHAQKRYQGMDLVLDELEECVPDRSTVESAMENKELSKIISNWLRTLSEDDRALFVRRYWSGESVNDLAQEWGMTPNKLAQRMFRLRNSLKAALEKEEVYL